MANVNCLYIVCWRPFLATVALLLIASTSNAQTNSLAKDEFDFDAKPHCSFGLAKSLLKANGEKPTGLMASKHGWDIEIYQNPETTSWALLGRRNAQDASKKLCYLDNGVSDYKKAKWYKEYFGNQ